MTWRRSSTACRASSAFFADLPTLRISTGWTSPGDLKTDGFAEQSRPSDPVSVVRTRQRNRCGLITSQQPGPRARAARDTGRHRRRPAARPVHRLATCPGGGQPPRQPLPGGGGRWPATRAGRHVHAGPLPHVHQDADSSPAPSSGPLVREQPGIRGIAPRRRALLPVRRLVMVGGDGQVDAVVTDGVPLTARWYRPGTQRVCRWRGAGAVDGAPARVAASMPARKRTASGTQAAAHGSPAPGAPQLGHEDVPVPARLPDITPVPRPEDQRPGTRRAVRAREPQITAGRRVRIDRKRARPYDGHGRHGLGSPSRGRRNAGVPDPEGVPPAVATTGTTSTCCPGPTARCVRRRAAREASFRSKRRSANAGDAEADA